MPAVPTRVSERVKSELKKLRPVLVSAKERDVNESDTGLLVAAILSDVLGYNRFLEITSEYAIRSTYCDLAVKLDGKLKLLVEIKAIGIDLKDNHLKQAVDYAANQGVDWVVLTNGIVWRAYKILFAKPIDNELVFEVNLLASEPKDPVLIERLYLLSREGVLKQAIGIYHEEKQATSRFMVAALLQTEPVLDVLRREIRRVSGGLKVEAGDLREMLRSEVIKRDTVEGDMAKAAETRVRKGASRALRQIDTAPTPPAGPSPEKD
jgi:hypothetical protein